MKKIYIVEQNDLWKENDQLVEKFNERVKDVRMYRQAYHTILEDEDQLILVFL